MNLGLITAIREDTTHPGEHFIKRITANLAPLYLAGYLEKKGLDLEVRIKDRLEDFEDFHPQILGISSVTENIESAKALARQAKARWGSLTILGGVHLTALPKSLPPQFDIGVIGEGEETLCDLIQTIERHGSLPGCEELAKIPGIVFHSPKGVQQTPFREGVGDLDKIPVPTRHRYIKHNALTYMMTSRGCPYTCNFCVIPATTKGYRTHSPHYVIEEIKDIKRHYPQVQNIRIFDDLFVVDRKRVAAIAERIDAEGISQDLSFGCWGRANLLDREMVKTLKKMNMDYVAFGAESGSSRVVSKIKPGSTLEQNQEAIDLLNDEGIGAGCSVILGHPLETEEDLEATYQFIAKNFDKILEVEFNVAIPWPGTELWHQAKGRGLVREDMDFNSLKEAALFCNYSTDEYPYLNEKIPPERFDRLMADFKKLFWKFVKRNEGNPRFNRYVAQKAIAEHY